MAYQYETTVIVTPVLTDTELKSRLKELVKYLKDNGATIVHEESWGLRKLAYPINKKTSGFYFTVEYQLENGELIDTMELALKRDDNILRFLTVSLDKYAIEYNDKKRKGLVGRKKSKVAAEGEASGDGKGSAKETAKEQA